MIFSAFIKDNLHIKFIYLKNINRKSIKTLNTGESNDFYSFSLFYNQIKLDYSISPNTINFNGTRKSISGIL